MRERIERLGNRTLQTVAGLGRVAIFGCRVSSAAMRPPWRLGRLVREIFDSGVLSLAIVCSSAFAVGMVLALQGYNSLVDFGAEESLGAVVGLSLIRELGPVITGLLVAGRAGSAMAAEIGMMVATEQIDGMRTMAVDPVQFVVAPKAVAMAISMPLLSALFIGSAVCGGWLVGVQHLGLDSGIYWSGLEDSVNFHEDVAASLVKALVFGVLIALVATYLGFTSERSTEGVSRATTRTVVIASVSILLADYLITAFWGV